LGWGFLLQQPLVVGGFTLLMVGLALNFWGVFSVGEGLTRLGAKPRKPGTEPLSTSAATGLLAVVVATPCTVPFMGAALGYALTQSVWASFAIFTAMGVGMALPFLLLAFTKKAAAWLPKPGAWMATFKHALGWPMLLTALWLAYVFASLTAEFAGQVALFALLLGATLLAFALWLYGQNPNRLRAALVVGAVLSSFVMLSPLTRPSQAQAVWAEWSVAAVEAARAEGRPVFVDFTADWCLTCKVTEATVLNTSAVQALFAEKNVALFKADWTARDDAITAELAKHGRQGVPLYLLYLPNQPEPQILPQLLSLGVLRGALEIK
jgi:thiol:disulfide interchange protein DsbD